MAKLRFLEVASAALFTSFVLWQATSSHAVWSTVMEETLTTTEEILSTTKETLTTTKGPDICEAVTCPPGQRCVLNATESHPVCICKESCTEPYVPVCGSDGQTYSHICDLGLLVCTTNRNITVQHWGWCAEKTPSDEYLTTTTQETTTTGGCSGVECPFYGKCLTDANNRPTCVCGLACPFIYRPVCGSNNQTYSNDCELRVDVCLTKTNITIQRKGICNARPSECDSVSCPADKYCVMNTTENLPQCICQELCFDIYDPVCGSDGRSYANDCVLGVKACKTNTNITIEHTGLCNGSNVCDGVRCPPGRYCRLGSDGQPKCICGSFCPAFEDPVCGSDGKTYSNECNLGQEACYSKTNTTIQHKGICNNSCTLNEFDDCPFYGKCVSDAYNSTYCVCLFVCSLIERPVCGSNNQTYSNECVLRKEACVTKTNITIHHQGICNDKTPSNTGPRGSPCDGVTCHTGEICQLNSEGQPQCTCPRICPLNEDPVCGSDGKTYGNECMLRVEACWSNTNITIQHRGICNDSCSGFECPFYGQCVLDEYNRTTCVCVLACPFIDRPVCGSDNKTYINDCAQRRESCVTNTSITFLYPGRCDGGSGCDGIVCPPLNVCKLSSDGKPKCICNETCSSEDAPVCASNGKTYGNRCLFNLAACWYDNNITVAYVGKCKPES